MARILSPVKQTHSYNESVNLQAESLQAHSEYFGHIGQCILKPNLTAMVMLYTHAEGVVFVFKGRIIFLQFHSVSCIACSPVFHAST